jgi:2-oxoglutarate dehydrogenase E2 component (dihydrolipoamide succinyltransferase)
MRVDIKVPSAGESVSEIRLSRWIKSDGDRVEKDDPLLELETDKANMELVADASGVLHVAVAAGTAVHPDDMVGYIETEAATAKPAGPPAEKRAEAVAEARPQPAAAQPLEPSADTSGAPAPSDNVSPAVRKLMREHDVDINEISGTGRKGRVRKEDVLEYVKTRESARPAAAPRPRPQPVPEPPPPAPEKPAAPPPEPGARERVVPMSLLRKKIAERMVRAQQTAAILTTFNEVDMTAVQELRAKYKEAFKEKYGISLGLMSFFVKASIEALKLIPQLNAAIDGDNIIYKEYYNIGVAVATDRGLVVPVLRDADALSFADVERKLAEYAAKAREGKISIDDLSGSTFTITNGGVFGSLLSTPILNPPESGILGMHTIQKRAVVINDQVVIRPMMYVALSYDHRIVDGKEAVTFLVRIKQCLEDPHRLLLGI